MTTATQQPPKDTTPDQVQWFNFAGKVVVIVDKANSNVGIGQLLSVFYNTSNGRYDIGLGNQVMSMNIVDTITIAQVTAGSTNITLGLGANVS